MYDLTLGHWNVLYVEVKSHFFWFLSPPLYLRGLGVTYVLTYFQLGWKIVADPRSPCECMTEWGKQTLLIQYCTPVFFIFMTK